MKYYLIAGEASGDLHGSNLMKELRKKDPSASFRIWGGDKMQQAGGYLLKHYRELAFMGFLEVVKNLRTILRNIELCKRDIAQWTPDVIILIDYPGFNFRIADWAKKKGFRIFYYISPQIWAWRSDRALKIKRLVDRMFVILPFEKSFYQQYNYEVDFVGHPLLDVIDKYPRKEAFLKEHNITKPIVALLPGSRKQEIKSMLPVMLAVIPSFAEYQFVLAAAPAVPLNFYRNLVEKQDPSSPLIIVQDKTYDLLAHSTAALVTSGTATLETALFHVPQIVCYKGNPFSYFIARRLVKVRYIALVNLIVNEPLVPELIQNAYNADQVKAELHNLLLPENTQRVQRGYLALEEELGEAGASGRAAELMWSYLQVRKQ